MPGRTQSLFGMLTLIVRSTCILGRITKKTQAHTPTHTDTDTHTQTLSLSLSLSLSLCSHNVPETTSNVSRSLSISLSISTSKAIVGMPVFVWRQTLPQNVLYRRTHSTREHILIRIIRSTRERERDLYLLDKLRGVPTCQRFRRWPSDVTAALHENIS